MIEDLELLCNEANEYFESIGFDGKIILSYINSVSVCICKCALHKNNNLFSDEITGKGYSGMYCPKCGKVYISSNVLSNIIKEVRPLHLEINFKTKGWFNTVSPKSYRGKKKNYDDGKPVTISEYAVKEKQVTEERARKQSDSNKKVTETEPDENNRISVTKITKRNNTHSLVHFGTTTFMVKSNTFACGKRGHKLVQVDGIIKVIERRTGDIKAILISAGYCEDCDQYFILDDMYDKLLAFGIPLCRIITIEYKAMHRQDKFDHYNNKSILMEYGYSVSRTDNLSDQTRHNILAVLMDYDICDRFTILSYLERFINDRKSRSNMVDAIKLWNKDIAFVNGYKKGTLKKQWIDILEIHKNTYKL